MNLRPVILLLASFWLLQACSSPEDEQVLATPVPALNQQRWPVDPGSSDSTPGAERTFLLSMQVTIRELPEQAQTLRLWIPAPRNEGAIQVVLETHVVGPAGMHVQERTTVDLRNRYWFITIDQPTAPVVITATASVLRRAQLNNHFRSVGQHPYSPTQQSALARELRASRLVPVTGRIRGLAQSIAPDEHNLLNIARAMYDHVRASLQLRSVGVGQGRGDTLWALDAGYGDSSDFHSLFISLCRARGIPARFRSGLLLPEGRGSGPIQGHHCWAEFHLPELGWVPVDAAQAAQQPDLAQFAFGALTKNRVALTEGRDLELLPRPAASPLNLFSEPHAELDQAPVPVILQVFYRDS